ncbi:MAG TPA: hypothetical protein VNK23_03195 [Candidatus Dormibacteraeota bacterium]|nr:hypothetical protein [Candidatus Dormibacteraeota bacterium]
MLFAIESSGAKPIGKVPHGDFYNPRRERLSDEQFSAMYEALMSKVDPAASEVYTSSWIPGSDWSGGPFQPIFDTACGASFDGSAKFFGILLWKVMMDRPEAWGFGRYEKDGIPIEGTTYFRLRELDGSGS